MNSPEIIDFTAPATVVEDDLDTLCQDWMETKQRLNELQIRLSELGERIDKKVGHKREGAKTSRVGPYIVETTGAVNRKVVNWNRFYEVFEEVPRSQQPVKESLDESKFRKLAVSDPGRLALLLNTENPAVTETEGKTGVKVALA